MTAKNNWRQSSNASTRRTLLKIAALAAAGAGKAFAAGHEGSLPQTARRRTFQYRLLLGWINDNSTRPLAGSRWPITTVDEQTVKDYRSFLRTARDYGYNGVTLCATEGLVAAGPPPLD
jgi:hypothetical protein